jgi:hypothetical protein
MLLLLLLLLAQMKTRTGCDVRKQYFGGVASLFSLKLLPVVERVVSE